MSAEPNTLNPRAPLANGVAVTTAAPLPVTSVAATIVDNGKIISPVVWVANGVVVDTAHPLPITLV